MFVSSNPCSQSFPHGSLLKQGCGVSVTGLCFTAIILSNDGCINDGQTFPRNKHSYFLTLANLIANSRKLTIPLTL
jgi:hypothetical protein